MTVLSKRLKILFFYSLAFSIVFIFGAAFLLLVAAEEGIIDEIEIKIVAIVLFALGGVFIGLGIFDLVRKPNELIVLDNDKRELLINKRSKVTTDIKSLKNNAEYYIVPIDEIVSVDVSDKGESMNPGLAFFLGGVVGYMIATNNHAVIIQLKEGIVTVNSRKAVKVATIIKDLKKEQTSLQKTKESGQSINL